MDGFTAMFEQGERYYIGYCLEVPGANGQGETLEKCRESLKEAIGLILEDRLEDGLRGNDTNSRPQLLPGVGNGPADAGESRSRPTVRQLPSRSRPAST